MPMRHLIPIIVDEKARSLIQPCVSDLEGHATLIMSAKIDPAATHGVPYIPIGRRCDATMSVVLKYQFWAFHKCDLCHVHHM